MKRDFTKLQNQRFDVLICGGGIYGAWTAYDAALRGLKVALVEQGDWASATSSASSKLIHGGLRYLESYDFKLVKKALAERQMLLQVAPHRVWPLRFGVPVYADSRMSRLQLKMGLMLYDFLAATPLKNMAHRYFNRDAFAQRFPALDTAQLKGGFTYSDAQTDDARMVLELVSGAMAAGAVCVNYCKLNKLVEISGRAKGALVEDQVSGVAVEIKAEQIVYATGQWLTTEKESSQWCRMSKGVHLTLPANLSVEALLLTTKSDGRVFFMLPWYGRTIVGTTDTNYQGDTQRIVVEESEISYLLEAVNHYLKTAWKKQDVIASYAGLRVMKRSEKASPSSVSRDWELKTASNGVHYSIGGKITSAREDASTIVDQVCAALELNTPCTTKGRLFPWAVEDYENWCVAVKTQAGLLNVDAESTHWLLRRHGKRAVEILKSIESKPELAKRITPNVPLIYADLLFSAQHEMVVHLHDLLRRRMPLLILAKLSDVELNKIVQGVSEVMAWSDSTAQHELAACTQQLP